MDHGIIKPNDTKNRITHGDFLDPNLDFNALGHFDVVTCNDVIEHVKDPALAILRISKLLKPDGVVFFEIPNARSINHVTKDGHFNLFGINLLSHYHAGAYLQQMTGAAGYSCGEFYSLDYYSNQMQNLGFSVKVLDAHKISRIDEVPSLIHKLSNQFTWSLVNELGRIDVLLRNELISQSVSYTHLTLPTTPYV